VSQTSLDDAKRLRKPMRIVHGALDPVVIKKNLDEIVAANDQAQLTVILAGHAILGPYVPAVIKQVESVLAPDS